MLVVLAGGAGFLGSALERALDERGHTVRVLTRRDRADAARFITWTPDGASGPWAHALEGAGALVNLSGEGVADQRWNERRKRALWDSRVLSTRSLVAALREIPNPPPVLVNGSASGYYGARGDELVTEADPPGSDFLGRLAVAWEAEAQGAASLTRVAIIRTGLVLHPDGGALGAMLLPFRLGVGGRLGSGTQYMPWIHRDDWVELVIWLIENQNASGAFNGTAPEPVTNAVFTRALGRALSRPTILPMPGFALRIAVGELAESLLTGQRAIPARAEAMGFAFKYKEIDRALTDLIR